MAKLRTTLFLSLLAAGAFALSPALAKELKKKTVPWTPDDVSNAPTFETWNTDGTVHRWTRQWEDEQTRFRNPRDNGRPEKKTKPDPPKVVGPASQRAAELSAQSRADVVGLRDTTVTRLGDTTADTGCNGAFCASSLEAATHASQAARQLVTSASQRQQAAEQERSRIFQGVQQGVREGQYTQAQAGELQRLFQSQARPTDKQIEELHQKLQDPAHALRINGDEITALKATKTEFTEVAQSAGQMERKLASISRRSDSIHAAPSSAAYPTGASRGPASGSLTAASSLAFRGDANKAGEKGEAASPSATKEGYNFGASGNLISTPAPTEGTKAHGAGAAPARLGADGTSMMAGLFQDLRQDLSQRSAPAGTLGEGKLGSASGGAMSNDGSLLGAAVRSIHAEATRGLRAPQEQGSLTEQGLFSSPKSLFVRVSETIRRKSARGGGLQ